MIIRTFHPIGQGAFYSERHPNFNIVYDCGFWKKNANLPEKVVTQAFSHDDVIDILFISHFDYDHVSCISTLINHVKKIKNVVLPLLHNQEKILLSNIYQALDLDLSTLINNPKSFFGDETKLIFVSSEDNRVTNELLEPINIDEITQPNIQNGQPITSNEIDDWVYIPFNYEHQKRHNQLINQLTVSGFDINKLKTDSRYTLDQIAQDVGMSKWKGGQIFKSIYDKLDGKINQNSMALYSGPLKQDIYYIIFSVYYNLSLFLSDIYRPACLYTGDFDLNAIDLKSVYYKVWGNIGTIQIPHHGGLKSFNINILNSQHYRCPISFSTNNSYGHPSSKVLGEIASRDCIPIQVTELLNSSYIEIITNYPHIIK